MLQLTVMKVMMMNDIRSDGNGDSFYISFADYAVEETA